MGPRFPILASRFRRTAVTMAIVAALATTVGVAPIAAASGDRGAVVHCMYEYLEEDHPYWGGILKGIEVQPPTLHALNASTAEIGWRFIVERQRFDQSYTAWVQTYKSGIQSIAANSAAFFAPMWVKVKLPLIEGYEEGTWNDVYYRVKLKFFWYRADGTLQQTVTRKMKHYQNWFADEYGYSIEGDYSCPGGHAWYVN